MRCAGPALTGRAFCLIAIAAHDALARNGQCDRVGGAGASDSAGRGQWADPTGQLRVAHGPFYRDCAKLLPDAALERRTAHIEREMKSFSRLVHEADHLGQIVVDDGLVRDELGLEKTGGEVCLQFAWSTPMRMAQTPLTLRATSTWPKAHSPVA